MLTQHTNKNRTSAERKSPNIVLPKGGGDGQHVMCVVGMIPKLANTTDQEIYNKPIFSDSSQTFLCKI